MKAFILCITVLCIANLNGALRSLQDLHPQKKKWIDTVWEQNANNNKKIMNGNPEQIKIVVDSIPDSPIVYLHDICAGGLSGEVTSHELTKCFKFIFDGLVEEDTLNDLYNFVPMVMDLIDTNSNGSLDFKEFKYLMSLLAATDALTIIYAYDANEDGAIKSDELQNFKHDLSTWIDENNVTAHQEALIKSALATEESKGYMTMTNFANFFVQMWVILTQYD